MARIARRKLLKLTGAGALAARTGGIAAILAASRAPAYAQGATVHWLRWNDFIPASDELLKKEIAPAAEKVLGIKLNIQKLEQAFDYELLEAAKVQVRLRVAPHTWEAFQLVAIEGLPVAEVAASVHMQVAMVYVAKSKVQKMLREEIQKLEADA